MHELQLLMDGFLEFSAKNWTDKQSIDKKLLRFIQNHKLIGKIDGFLLEKLQHTEMISQYFYEQLKSMRYKLGVEIKEHTLAIIEIMNIFFEMEIKDLPIVLKGLSIYGLTNNVNSIKKSSDIDLIYSDPVLLEALLKNIGYRRVEPKGTHEHCVMLKGNIILEIHNYFPVIDYTEEISNKAKKAKANHFNVFFQIPTLQTTKLTYQDMLSGVISCDFLGGALILDANFQVLLISAHLFRSYVNSQFQYSCGVTLCELLDVLDMVNHSSFDYLIFENYVKMYNASSSVEFVAYLIKTIFNHNKFSEYFHKKESLFPKSLFWSGAMYIPSHKEEFLYHGINEFVSKLVTNRTIPLGDVETEPLQELLYNSHGVANVEYISFRKNDGSLVIKLKFPKLINDLTADVFEIFFNSRRCCFVVENGEIQTEAKPEGCNWMLIDYVMKYSVIIELPFNLLFEFKQDTIGMVIGITRWGNGPLTTLVPVLIDSPNKC